MTTNIGILDPEGKNPNPLTNEPYSDEYKEKAKNIWTKLPVYEVANDVINDIKENQVLILSSGTGSGKSVLVPKYALHAIDYKGKVVITNPKTLATRTNAKFNADLLDVKLGKEVGFQYRGSKLDDGSPSKSDDTKLLFSTDGSIVAQIARDPALKAYDIVIIDEAHERQIQIDILLLLMRRALKLNPDLKLIVMSATLNEKEFIDYFKDFKPKYVELPAKPNFPVEDIFLDKPTSLMGYGQVGAELIVEKIIKSGLEGATLFFVTSGSESNAICQTIESLVSKNKLPKTLCIELTGGSSKEDKDLATEPELFKDYGDGGYEYKVVIATNVAESSVTIKDLKFVVDNGYEINDAYNAERMEQKLVKQRISKAQAIQRAGRVGRTEPGMCFKLYTEAEYKEFPDNAEVDIVTKDLTGEVFRFLGIEYIENIKDLKQFIKEFITVPPEINVDSALKSLYAISAIDSLKSSGKLTDLGLILNGFRKVDPFMGRSLLFSQYFNCKREMIDIAAILLTIDGKMEMIFQKFNPRKYKPDKVKDEQKNYNNIRKKFASSYGDIITLLKVYTIFREKAEKMEPEEVSKWCKQNFLNYRKLKDIKQKVRIILQEMRSIEERSPKKNTLEDAIEKINENTEQKGGFVQVNSIQKIKDIMRPFPKLEDNITFCLFMGYFTNIAKLKYKSNYQNCFPEKLTDGNIDRNSFLTEFKTNPKFIIYITLQNIFGKQSFNLVTKIPNNIVSKLDKIQMELVKRCF